ncbi:MAG: hypothetical protein H6772_00590 [Pseudomonadales bacterium]|nr:hypothetical protein [Pseudomonadales bacterium]
MIKKITIFLLLLIIFWSSSWALFRNDFFYVHDYTQGARIVEMKNALSDGHFPVRWSQNFGYGYGMPLFEFYAPLPYYVGGLIYLLGFSLINSIKALFLISALISVIGGYKLGKELFGSSWGVVVAAAITLAPYRALNLFVRGAVSESWGVMVLPFILYGIILVVKNKKNGWITLLFSLITLLLSHNLTSLIFIPLSIIFSAVYLLISFYGEKNWFKLLFSRLLVLTGTYLLSILISTFYIIPALAEKSFTRIDQTVLATYFDYNLHFLSIKQFFEDNWQYGGSSFGPNDDISFYLGTGQLMGLAISGILLIKSFYSYTGNLKKIHPKKIYLFLTQKFNLYFLFLGLLLFSVFMSVYKSKFIWDQLSFLSYIQFPWRWLSASIIFLAIVIGYNSKFLKGKFHRFFFAGAILLVIIFSNWKFFQPAGFLSETNLRYYDDSQRIRAEMSKTLPDFIPIQMAIAKSEPLSEKSMFTYVPVGKMFLCEFESVDSSSLTGNELVIPKDNCNFKFSIIADMTQKKLVEVETQELTLVEFALADFPGWTAKIDGNVIPHQVGELGTIIVPVEAGNHLVGLEFKGSKIRIISDRLSLFGLIIFLLTLICYYRKLLKKKLESLIVKKDY